MVATPELDLSEDGRRLVIQSDGATRIELPSDIDVLNGAFRHVGNDLLIETASGQDIVVADYFAGSAPPDLLLGGRAQMAGGLVERLAARGDGLQLAENTVTLNDAGDQLAQTGEAIGQVETISGTVTVQHQDGSRATLAEGDSIFLNDVVAAGSDGEVGIVFVDGTNFSLSAGARMTMDEMVYDPASGGGSFVASVLQGTFVFSTGSIAPNGNMEVVTPVGTIGIRGTTVAARIALEGSDTVILLLKDADGHVGRVIIQNAGGIQEINQENAAVSVSSFFIAPGEPVIMSGEQVLQYFDEVLRQLQRLEGTGPADEQGGATEDGDASDQAALENFDPGELSTAAGGEQPGDLTQPDQTDQLSELLGFVPDALQPVSFISVNLFGHVTTAGITLGSANAQPGGITLDNLDPFQPQTPPPPTSSFIFFTGGAGNDTLDASGAGGASYVTGSAGDDILIGSPGDDQIYGGAGNDTIVGGHGGGNDLYDGGDGEDTVVYTSADESIIVDLTNGTAFGDPDIGVDKLLGIENVIGGSGDDVLIGNAGKNVLNGANGADQLSGLGGDDVLDGGSSGVLTGAPGNGIWQEDVDIAVFTGNAADYIINVNWEDGYIIVSDTRPGGDGTDTIYNIEMLRFADQDVLTEDLQDGVNRAPSALELSATTVAENVPGAVVGTLTVTDPDLDDYHTYTVSDPRFEVVEGELRLSYYETLDFESEPSITVEVTVRDSAGLTHTQNFVIDVSNANDAPTGIVDTNVAVNTIDAWAEAGTEVGIVAAAIDPDAGDSFTYSLQSDYYGAFAIDPVTGVVTFVSPGALDETIGNDVSITVLVTDSAGATTTQSFTISVFADGGETGDQAPSLDNALLTIASGGSDVIDSLQLLTSDPDTAPESIVYTVVALPAALTGVLMLGEDVLGIGDTFTQADINTGNLVLFGGTTESYADSFTVNITDGTTTLSNQTIDISIVHNGVVAHGDAGVPNQDNPLIIGDTGFGRVDAVGDAAIGTTSLILGNQAGGTGVLRMANGASLEVDPDGAIVGKGGAGHLLIESGATANIANRLVIGDAADSIGRVDVDGLDSSLTLSGVDSAIIVGNDGAGTLNVTNGAQIGALQMQVARGDGSFGIVNLTGAGSQIVLSNDYGLGSPPDDIYAGSATVGRGTGSEGILNVTAGASLVISQGSAVNTETIEPWLTIGRGVDSTGVVTVSGTGSSIAIGNADSVGSGLHVAREGDGALIVSDGADVTVRGENSYVTMGAYAAGTGVLTVQSGGTFNALDMRVGRGGDGTLQVTGTGSQVTLSSQFGHYSDVPANEGSEYDESLEGGFIRVGQDAGSVGVVQISDGGQLLVTNDLATEAPGFQIGRLAGSEGHVFVDGLGSRIDIVEQGDGNLLDWGPYLNIGQEGTGTMMVSNGGVVHIDGTNADLMVGQQSGGEGTLTVTGAGSLVSINGTNNFASVGHQAGGTGTIHLLNGGQFEAADLRIGRAGDGTMTIEGPGSKATISSQFGHLSDDPETEFEDESLEAGFVRVGQEAGSHGMLSVLAGGVLLITNDADTAGPGLQVGRHAGSNGEVLVSGAGSTISIVEGANGANLGWGPYLEIGIAGTGHMAVKDGGAVNLTGEGAILDISRDLGSYGSLTIDGTGSVVNVSGDDARLTLGNLHETGNSAGAISISNGGALNVDSGNAESTYNIYVNEGSLLQISNGSVTGSVSITGGTLDSGLGTALINGDVSLFDSTRGFLSTVSIDVIGTGSSDHGAYNINGAFNLYHGAFAFHFAGYAPQLGDAFTFLTATQVSLGGLPLPDLADISLVAYGVSQSFDFQINATGTTIGFEALNSSAGGNAIVFKGGNQDDIFGGETGYFLNLSGGGGDDTLISGFDAVGNGHHIINGGAGADWMQGGNGNDYFQVTSVNDNFSVGENGEEFADFDRIVNFDTTSDRIVFDNLYDGIGGWAGEHGFQEGFDFIKLATGVTYDGTNASGTEYANGNAVLILEDLGGNNYNLIYDDNGTADGYTIVANIQTTGGEVTAANALVA